jgi:hypothetical protein
MKELKKVIKLSVVLIPSQGKFVNISYVGEDNRIRLKTENNSQRWYSSFLNWKKSLD